MDTVIPLRLAAGFRRGSHRRSNGFVRFDFTELQEAVVIALLATAYDYMPAIRDYVPEGWVKWAALLIIAARVAHQKVPGDVQ